MYTKQKRLQKQTLGTGTEKVWQLAKDFRSSSRRGNRRMASYATVATTQKTGKKTSRLSKLFRARSLAQLMTVFGLVLSLASLIPLPASADGLADTPLPILPGTTKPAKHVYSVPDVENKPRMTTSFHCTSTLRTGGKPIRWGVEVFESGALQNDVAAFAGVGPSILPGDTQIISMVSTELFGGSTLPIQVNRGSARIIADSTKIICTAFLLDPANNPPTFVTTVPIIKQTRQNGPLPEPRGRARIRPAAPAVCTFTVHGYANNDHAPACHPASDGSSLLTSRSVVPPGLAFGVDQRPN